MTTASNGSWNSCAGCTVGYIEHVVLIHNVPSDPVAEPDGGWPFRLTELFNTEQAGFGANHNLAFSHCTTEYFCVLNPDIELRDASVWEKLLERLREPMVGCAYPLLFNPDGSRQENERELVTPLALLRRHLLKLPQRRVDWVSGAFWMVRSAAWRSLGGFDERFYMYCEDVDFCLRLQLAGWKLAAADVAVTHDASWGSRSPGRHMALAPAQPAAAVGRAGDPPVPGPAGPSLKPRERDNMRACSSC